MGVFFGFLLSGEELFLCQLEIVLRFGVDYHGYAARE